MTGKRKKWRVPVLAAIVIALLITPAATGTDNALKVKPAVEKTVSYLLAQEKTQGQPLSPWSYVALAGAGQKLAGSMVLQSCAQQSDSLQSGELNGYSLLVLTLLAAGGDPYDYKGQNLIREISAAQLPDGKFADNIDRSGAGDNGEQVLLNTHVWAVLALHAARAETPGAGKAKQWLLDRQHADGSFYWYTGEEKSDVDSTGMALTALGILGENKDSPAVRKAAAYLKSVQENDGGFASWGAANPESCRYVIEGLTAAGMDPAGADWTKDGGNPVSALMSYQLPDGSFEHAKGTGSNAMSTEQALLGLSDYYCGNTVIERLGRKNPPAAGTDGKTRLNR
ncbi:MAG: Prenyltransferase and squalene oxidase repeat protein [Pelotomaculum sp. PtaB.Bin104]|nr:MAG: Prenyltransferase and squalene oxidase repeat protein [Pelotomaculum sp. PtaB.Bin104]